MRKAAPLFLLALMPVLAEGQVPTPPHVPGADAQALTGARRVIVLDEAAKPAEEPAHTDRGALFRYGIPQQLELDFMLAAEWTAAGTDSVIGRLAIKSPGALTMNLFFSEFRPAGNAEISVSSGGSSATLNVYGTRWGHGGEGQLQTALTAGDEVTIEFRGTTGEQQASTLRIGHVVHGLVDFFGAAMAGPGEECLVDVACATGNAWTDESRSIVMFTREDGNGCTGVLLNNTSGDFTPYVHIAHHCRGTFNPNNWVFYFNYQKPTCEGGVAPMSQSLTGGQVVASDYDGDFDLIRLNQAPPPAFNAYYAGWDRSGNTPASGAFIGHPSSGPKKIGTWSGASTGTYPEISKPLWFANITQGAIFSGSSGSPLFDANKRMVGATYFGHVGCEGTRQVHAVKMSANWNGTSAAKRLKDWLDPAGTGATTLNGASMAPAGTASVQVKVKMALQGAFDPANGLMRAQLEVPTTEPYTAMGYQHKMQGGGETAANSVLKANGNARIVDWVVVELRQANYPHAVVATRSALLRRDGQVAELDGTLNGISFQGLAGTTYRVAVRHRNHLGVMTGQALDLAAGTLINMAAPNGTGLYGTDAAATVGTVRCLWMGDVQFDGVVKYTGSANDRDPILGLLGGTANTTVSGYHPEDTNMDGVVKYAGANNDRDPLWSVLGGNVIVPRTAQLP